MEGAVAATGPGRDSGNIQSIGLQYGIASRKSALARHWPECAVIGLFMAIAAAYLVAGSSVLAGRKVAKVGGIDAVAYFGVSHSLLFDRDFDLTNEYRRVPPAYRTTWTDIRPETGKPASPWGVGYSLVAIPFLAAGTVLDRITGQPADGYGPFAMLLYCETNVVLGCIGLIATMALLRRLSVFEATRRTFEWMLLAVAIGTVFGTNVGFYALAPTSHATSFAALAVFLLLSLRRSASVRVVDWLLLGLVGGLLSVARWQDAPFVIVPFAMAAFGDSRAGAGGWSRRVLGFAAGVACFAIPQMLEWKTIYGTYLLVPQNRHAQSFFEFPPPYVLRVLFSTRSGWFVWTPVAALGIAGFATLARRTPALVLSLFGVLALELTIIGGARITWNGQDSFSARYLTSAAVLVAVGLMALLCNYEAAMRRGILALMCVGCVFTTLFMIQFRLGLIPRDSYLTYSELFTDKAHLIDLYRRKLVVRTAAGMLDSGHASEAIAALESLAGAKDQEAFALLSKAYKEVGRQDDAQRALRAYRAIQDSRLY